MCIRDRRVWATWLLPEEFTPSAKFPPQSDLWHRADSRWASPQISSLIFLYRYCYTLLSVDLCWLLPNSSLQIHLKMFVLWNIFCCCNHHSQSAEEGRLNEGIVTNLICSSRKADKADRCEFLCVIKACIDVFGGMAHITPWDSVLLAAVEMDIHQVIRQCRSYSSFAHCSCIYLTCIVRKPLA